MVWTSNLDHARPGPRKEAVDAAPQAGQRSQAKQAVFCAERRWHGLEHGHVSDPARTLAGCQARPLPIWRLVKTLAPWLTPGQKNRFLYKGCQPGGGCDS